MSFLKKHKKVVIPSAVAIAIVLFGTAILGYQVSSDKIAKNVYISDVNLEGLTKTEAVQKLKDDEQFKKITLEHKKMKWDVYPDEVDMKVDFTKTVDNAYMSNRNGGFISNLFSTLKADFGTKINIPLVTSYDEGKVSAKLEKIKTELDAPVKNATLNYDSDTKKTSIVPDEAGRTMDVNASKVNFDKSIKGDNFKIELAVKLEEAKFKESDLKGIDTLLGGFSTNYGGLAGRDFNIKKSAEDSSGIILKPGEEFSFNGLTGEKTIANGYKYAPVIESGKLVLGCGGGVCQTSSTIFNAALLSGMEITTRRNHTIPSNYVSLGRDATVFDGNPGQDFKFKNPYKNNVYVKNFTVGSKVVSQIFGNKADYQNIEVTTQMLGSTGAGTKTISDPSLPAGKKVVEKYASPGYTVATYRVYKDNSGKTIKTEKVGISSYPAQMGIVRVGAAKVAKKPVQPGTAQTVPQTNVPQTQTQ